MRLDVQSRNVNAVRATVLCIFLGVLLVHTHIHRKIWLLYKITGKENGSKMSTRKTVTVLCMPWRGAPVNRTSRQPRGCCLSVLQCVRVPERTS